MRGAFFGEDLDRAMVSEVLGESIFATAARVSFRRWKRDRWARLADLESLTKWRLLHFLEGAGLEAKAPASTAAVGRVAGVLLALLPWPFAMRALEWATIPFTPVFERLRAACEPWDDDFFAYLVEHERAIADFARSERRGQHATSLEPVAMLLRAHRPHGPPRTDGKGLPAVVPSKFGNDR